jgi:lipopolysaccharide/colanic/teichoic acid biosynthesis glycosyltransferase
MEHVGANGAVLANGVSIGDAWSGPAGRWRDDWTTGFRIFKALTDRLCGLAALPAIALLGLVLLLINPLVNPGPLFFRQERMGRNGRPFRMWKFRTMRPAPVIERAPEAPVERDRITPLGRILRRTRLDELPNFINVLRGEMSLIGPRPDAIEHARHFSGSVPGYRTRLRVLPGITGLAQVELGYTEGASLTAVKAQYDRLYVERSCLRLELYIIRRTVFVMLSGFGAK